MFRSARRFWIGHKARPSLLQMKTLGLPLLHLVHLYQILHHSHSPHRNTSSILSTSWGHLVPHTPRKISLLDITNSFMNQWILRVLNIPCPASHLSQALPGVSAGFHPMITHLGWHWPGMFQIHSLPPRYFQKKCNLDLGHLFIFQL
jgi:hypothetical protein